VVPKGDLVVQVLPTGFSHSIVLRAPPKEAVEYRFEVRTDDLRLVEESAGTLSLRRPSGKEVGTAPVPLMWDDSGGAADAPEQVEKLRTTVESEDGVTQLVLIPDPKMLADPSTQYPVTIDPSFVTRPSRDTWVANVGYTTSQYASTELRAGSYDGGRLELGPLSDSTFPASLVSRFSRPY